MAIELNTKHNPTKTKTVYTRLDFSWYLISALLDGLSSQCRTDDKEFNRLFSELRTYVENKFFSCCDGEITDMFVVAEQTVNN